VCPSPFLALTVASSITQATQDGDVHMLSRLSTSAGLAHMFKEYASSVDASWRRRSAGIMSMDIDTDDIVELISDLWTIYDSYPVETKGYEFEGAVGSDEE